MDSSGRTYIRVETSAFAPGQLADATNTQSNRHLDTLLANSVFLDGEGRPTLRLALVAQAKKTETVEAE